MATIFISPVEHTQNLLKIGIFPFKVFSWVLQVQDILGRCKLVPDLKLVSIKAPSNFSEIVNAYAHFNCVSQ